MATMNLTLIGMYNYDNSLFDSLELPEPISKDDFIQNLLLKSGEFELLYPSFDFLQDMISLWGRKWKPTFEKWVKGQEAEWNPIENYDRYEDSHDVDHVVGSGSDVTGVKGGGTTTDNVSAFDSNTYQPSSQSIADTHSDSTSITNATNDSNRTHDSHIHGNIGVTQASDMLKSFYEIAKWNLLDHMADVFINEFCIQVY